MTHYDMSLVFITVQVNLLITDSRRFPEFPELKQVAAIMRVYKLSVVLLLLLLYVQHCPVASN